ncbi:hypothetical protein J7K92_01650 [bacterium]|nr:hypothetical protein [bacterium]
MFRETKGLFISLLILTISMLLVAFFCGLVTGEISLLKQSDGIKKFYQKKMQETENNLKQTGGNSIDSSEKRKKFLAKAIILEVLPEEQAVIIKPAFNIDDPSKEFLSEQIKVRIIPETELIKRKIIYSKDGERQEEILPMTFSELNNFDNIYLLESKDSVIGKSEIEAKKIIIREIIQQE